VQARIFAFILVALAGCRQPARTNVMSVCDLSRDFTAHRDQIVAVRGVYFYGLREACPQTCATGLWPSFVDLVGSDTAGDAIWAEVVKGQNTAEQEGKQGRRVEVWVSVRGKLNASEHRSPVGPCDRVGIAGSGISGPFRSRSWWRRSAIFKSSRTPVRPTTTETVMVARFRSCRHFPILPF